MTFDPRPSADQLRRALRLVAVGLALCIAVPGAAALARSGLVDPVREAAAEEAAPAPEPILVWQGEDVDGDGEGDFANPTGHELRLHDDFGDGWFGASRDGGERDHEGADYMGVAGQPVGAPISGYVTKIGYAYDDSRALKFIEITNPALGYEARVFYVNPEVKVGDAVALGAPIGVLDSLQSRYPGITDHVHLELMRGGRRFNAAVVIQPAWVTPG